MNPSLCTAERKTDKHCEFWNEKEMGHIDTVQGSIMGPITTLNTEKMGHIYTVQRPGRKWGHSPVLRGKLSHIDIVQRPGTNWDPSPLWTGKMGHIDIMQRPGTKWGISPMSREQQQNHETLRNIRLSWDSNQRHPVGVQEEGTSG